MDALAVWLTIPPTGFVRDLHPQVSAPCRAHNQKGARSNLAAPFDFSISLQQAISFHRRLRRLSGLGNGSAPRCITAPLPTAFANRINPSPTPYGQVGELLRILVSLMMNEVSGWRRLMVAPPEFLGAM